METMLAALLLFGGIAIALSALTETVAERAEVFRTLRSARTIELAPSDIRQRQLALPFQDRVLAPMMRRFGHMGRRFAPASVVERLNQELVYAGSPVGWDAERVLALKLLLAIATPFAVIIFGAATSLSAIQVLVLALFGAFVGYYMPEWVVRARAGKRQERIRRALPEALDLLAITVEAGLAFDAAIGRVARQAGGPLGEELHRVLQEMQLGKMRSDALRDLGERTTVQELKSFVLAMVQADVFGISIASVLQTQARELRIKRRQRAEEKAQKLQVKLIFPLLFCIFPALFVVLLGPAAITIYEAMLNR